ncbi:hypothetical protein [Sphingobium sp.]|uniref:hypothetical protein n=1 Tax=Sphingobium sp. TaxID=1912891 RepID=UPI0035C75A6D
MPRSALFPSAIVAASLLSATPSRAEEGQAGSFITMEEISVPIIDASRIEGALRVSVVLQARDADGAAELARRMPELRMAGLSAAIEFARLHASPFSAVDAARLSSALTHALKGMDKRIAEVLIVKVSAMPE